MNPSCDRTNWLSRRFSGIALQFTGRKTLSFARTVSVNHACNDLLADTALTREQNGCRSWSDFFYHGRDSPASRRVRAASAGTWPFTGLGTLGWNSENGAMRAPYDTLGCTSPQRVEKIHMALGGQHHQVGTPMSFFLKNLIHGLALSHGDLTGPASHFRQNNFWCRPRLSHVNQAKLSCLAIKPSR